MPTLSLKIRLPSLVTKHKSFSALLHPTSGPPSPPGKAPSPGASTFSSEEWPGRVSASSAFTSIWQRRSMSVPRMATAFRATSSCQHGQPPRRGPVSPHNTSKPGLRKLLPKRAGDQIFKALWDTAGLRHVSFRFGFCERWQAPSAHRLCRQAPAPCIPFLDVAPHVTLGLTLPLASVPPRLTSLH